MVCVRSKATCKRLATNKEERNHHKKALAKREQMILTDATVVPALITHPFSRMRSLFVRAFCEFGVGCALQLSNQLSKSACQTCQKHDSQKYMKKLEKGQNPL
eukprot:6486775-Amphidinium_carterae.1